MVTEGKAAQTYDSYLEGVGDLVLPPKGSANIDLYIIYMLFGQSIVMNLKVGLKLKELELGFIMLCQFIFNQSIKNCSDIKDGIIQTLKN